MSEDILGSGFIKDADIRSFEVLFKSHYSKLVLYSNRFVNDLAIAEEVVSDAFAWLWEERSTLIVQTSVTSYLYKMVQNRSLNYIKHQKIRNEYVQYLVRNNLLSETPDYDSNPYMEKELADNIKAAIESLPEKCQEVFKLSRYQHLKNREIAELLNISPKTVERHMTIALEKIRASLKHLVFLIISILHWG